ncbi:helix-turn-helix transcriptional regulator [Riemerella anatipestifer]|uniref:helix-turn-helix domain-containing protein n=1 Tax=Riemerella anatipestifer TaxID=34085 RepID=UPI002857CEFB|nr:helix-turn-helix transcriptional regulator [Riemerella anatipestifer]MDR7832303.1 helix-turn-helix transcriptional regulator [Riemerella anatipestifer]
MLRLKEILKDKGVTGKELANKIGLTETSISRIVKNEQFPNAKTLKDISNALNIPVRDLFAHSDNETPLYIQNEQGDYVEVGSLRIDTLNPKKISE